MVAEVHVGGRTTVSEGEAWTWLGRAREVRIAAVVGGRPLLRTMHAAVVGGRLVLHGAPRSEKASWVGAPVVAAAEEVVARVPSWMRHPERACPATTYYRSVQVRGRMVSVEDPDVRAAALQVLMEQLQPEGRYRPLQADDPLYASTVRGLGMWAVEVDRISGVSKLGQHLRGSELGRILAGLWERGDPGDLEAIEALSAAHPERPCFVELPAPLRPRCALRPGDRRTLVRWLGDAYWNRGVTGEEIDAAHQASDWVGIEEGGRLVASARATSDGAKRAWIYDVVVEPASRGQGLGTRVLELLLDHPRVRGARRVQLVTRDAQRFYARLGFAPQVSYTVGSEPRTAMIRERTSPWPGA